MQDDDLQCNRDIGYATPGTSIGWEHAAAAAAARAICAAAAATTTPAAAAVAAVATTAAARQQLALLQSHRECNGIDHARFRALEQPGMRRRPVYHSSHGGHGAG